MKPVEKPAGRARGIDDVQIAVLLEELVSDLELGRFLAGAARIARLTVGADAASAVFSTSDRFQSPPARTHVGAERAAEEWVSSAMRRAAVGWRDATRLALAVPVCLPGESALGAVVVEDCSPLGEADELALRRLAALLAPAFHRLRLEQQGTPAAEARAASTFRSEAVAEYAAGDDDLGRPVRLDPVWLRWGSRLTAIAGLALLGMSFVPVDELATGPAIVRIAQDEITASASGMVEDVVAAPGERVAAGQPLLRLVDRAAAAELAGLDHEIGLLLVERMRRPDDRATADAMIAARARRREIEQRQATSVLVAPHAGRILGLRARRGELVAAGTVLATLSDEAGGEPEVIAFLPAWTAPYVRQGMRFDLRIEGDGAGGRAAVVVRVGETAIGPTAARWEAGPALADAIDVTGAAVPVWARFDTAGHQPSLPLADGMTARARLAVRSRPLVFILFPGLSDWLPKR